MSTETAPYCYRHPDRETHISCQRCGRPICPDCMNQAAVGFQCPSCVQEGARTTRQGRTTYGGKRSGDPTLTSKVLIGINVAVWLLITVTGGVGGQVFDALALLPNGGLTPTSDGSVVLLPDGVADGAYWQLLTSMFVHYSVLHIGFNMLALWIFGPELEAVFGRLRFLAIYFLGGLAGSAAVYLLAYPFSSTVGASGAIFALFGAYLIVALKTRRNVGQLVILLVLNGIITVTVPRISWQGHLGGLVGGVLVALILVYSPRANRTLWQGIGLGLVALTILAAVVTRTAVLV